MSSSANSLSPLEALKAGFRRACVRRLVGDEDGAIDVLKNQIPSLVVGWAKVCNLEPSEKKAKLKEMFDDESARADELATAFDLFAGRFEARVALILQRELKDVVAEIRALVTGIKTTETQKIPLDETTKLVESVAVEKNRPEQEHPEDELEFPRGMGLKFDEIEQMIDEVLSKED